ncbi:hypothetical protein JCM18899A_10720 [Nocardioides sp. AN3]
MGSEEEKPSLEAPRLGLRRRRKPTPLSGEPSTDPQPPAVHHSPPPRTARRRLNAHLAAALAGLVVGAFLVLATLGGLNACESIRGTASCGGGPGSLLLLLIVVLAVFIGAAVLRWASVPSATSISVLAVALVSVLSMLFLTDALDQLTGAVAVGILSVAAYLLAHWVTARYLDAAA